MGWDGMGGEGREGGQSRNEGEESSGVEWSGREEEKTMDENGMGWNLVSDE